MLLKFAQIKYTNQNCLIIVYANANFERSASDLHLRVPSSNDMNTRNMNGGYYISLGQPPHHHAGIHHQVSGDFAPYPSHLINNDPYHYQRLYAHGVSNRHPPHHGSHIYHDYPSPKSVGPIYILPPNG